MSDLQWMGGRRNWAAGYRNLVSWLFSIPTLSDFSLMLHTASCRISIIFIWLCSNIRAAEILAHTSRLFEQNILGETWHSLSFCFFHLLFYFEVLCQDLLFISSLSVFLPFSLLLFQKKHSPLVCLSACLPLTLCQFIISVLPLSSGVSLSHFPVPCFQILVHLGALCLTNWPTVEVKKKSTKNIDT